MTIKTYTIEWNAITIDITHNDEFSYLPHLEEYAHHIIVERRGEGQLPFTNTGFKSYFAIGKNKEHALAPYKSAIELVRAWLNETAQSKEWKRYEREQMQLSLF